MLHCGRLSRTPDAMWPHIVHVLYLPHKYQIPIKWSLRHILSYFISSLSLVSPFKATGRRGRMSLELAQRPALRVSRPYPTRSLHTIGKLRTRCRWRAPCCRRAPRRRHPRVVTELYTRCHRRDPHCRWALHWRPVASSFVSASSSTSTSLDSAKQQEDVALKVHVTSVCFKYFRWMLHKLPWLYKYVASVLFQMFQLFHTYVASVLSECCMWFTHILSVLSGCYIYFIYMLEVLHCYGQQKKLNFPT
jgi:hypothetical protein